MKINWGTGTDMARRQWEAAVAALIFSLAVPAWGEQQYLYSPKPVGPEEQSRGKDDILVREVPVEKGDTLSGISRKFSGRSSYYPQILIFNDVKNPNLIYAGSTLRVPVGKGQAAEASEAAPIPSTRKKAGRHTGKKKAEARRKGKPEAHKRIGAVRQQKANKPLREERAARRVPGTSSAPATGGDAGQKLFAQAVNAYRQGDCRTALDLFDRFLTTNPGSPLAADASLYKAECYLKLSN